MNNSSQEYGVNDMTSMQRVQAGLAKRYVESADFGEWVWLLL